MRFELRVEVTSPAFFTILTIYIMEDIFFVPMSDTWKKFDNWTHVQKMLLLILAIAVFFPIIYFIFLPIIGAVVSIVVYLVLLLVIGFLIRIWGKEKLEK